MACGDTVVYKMGEVAAYIAAHLPREAVHPEGGLSFIAPNGSGKSWIIDKQPYGRRLWTDADPLLLACGAQPPAGDPTWETDLPTICKRVDRTVVRAKDAGLWLLGATWWDSACVDAFIVLPPKGGQI
jgi:hypothetical protein